MSIVREALRPFWVKGINEVSSGTTQSLKGWIADGQYVVQSVAPAPGMRIDIFTANSSAILSALAHDADRFSSSAFETAKGIPNENEIPRSLAWPLIRAYYAAFYATHALSRLFGISITKLDDAQVHALRNAAVSSGFGGLAQSIHPELYKFEFDPAAQVLIGTKLTKGSHEDTWVQFEKLLGALSTKLLQTSIGIKATNLAVVDLLEGVREILRTNPCAGGNWLSHIRNNINYRHDYGVWYPHGTGNHRNQIDSLFRRFGNDPIDLYAAAEQREVVRFSKCCVLLVCLLREVVEETAARHSTSRSFLLQKALPVLRQASWGRGL